MSKLQSSGCVLSLEPVYMEARLAHLARQAGMKLSCVYMSRKFHPAFTVVKNSLQAFILAARPAYFLSRVFQPYKHTVVFTMKLTAVWDLTGCLTSKRASPASINNPLVNCAKVTQYSMFVFIISA
jgi:hypothetical protein